jgi:ribosomal protein L11 methyltransferase
MDVVVANILAPVLIEQSDEINATVRPGGVVILSGMRNDQIDKVLKNFSQFIPIDTVEDDGWVAVALLKKDI